MAEQARSFVRAGNTGGNGIDNLVAHSRANMLSGKGVKNADGSMSTIRSGSVNDSRLNDGRATLIPFIWNGKEVGQEQAIEFAVQSGKRWPDFPDHSAATETSKWISSQLPSSPEGWEKFKGLRDAP